MRSVGSIVKEVRDHQLGELMSVARAQLLGREAYQAWVTGTGPLEFLKDPWRLDKVGSPSVSYPQSDVRTPPVQWSQAGSRGLSAGEIWSSQVRL